MNSEKIIQIVLKILSVTALLWFIAFAVSRILAHRHTEKPFVQQLAKFTIVGHRGASREYPGNTIAAFKRLKQIHPDAMLELDVWGSKDNRVIVSHDCELEKATDGKGMIYEHPLRELKRLNAGYNISFDSGKSYPFRDKKIQMASLDEVFQDFPNSPISIDIKYHKIDFTDRVLALIKEKGMTEKVIIGSFDSRIIRHIHNKYPDIATSMGQGDVIFFFVLHRLHLSGLFRSQSDAFLIPEFTSGDKPEYLGPGTHQGIRVITRRFIRDANHLGYPVMAWTINRDDNMKRLIDWKINGIITDFPDHLKNIYLKKNSQKMNRQFPE